MKRQRLLSIPSLMSLSFNMTSGLDSRLTVAGITEWEEKHEEIWLTSIAKNCIYQYIPKLFMMCSCSKSLENIAYPFSPLGDQPH